MNPSAEPGDVSFTWNALLPWWVSWKGIAKEYLLARAAAQAGNIEPLKTFYQETMAQSWEDRLGIIEDYGFLEARKAPYDYCERWPEAIQRFMAADRQEKGGEHYWWVIRDFGPFGKSRLVSHGRCSNKLELEEIRKSYGVLVGDAVIDSGYSAQDIYRFCMVTGWKAFKGEDREFYLVRLPDPKNPKELIVVRQMWQRTEAVVYNSQTKMRIGNLPLYLFSNSESNDLLAEYLNGLVGEFTVPENTAKEYFRMLAGDVRMEHVDPKGVVSYNWHTVSDNHYRDCERMILTSAIAKKVIHSPGKVHKRGQAAKPIHA